MSNSQEDNMGCVLILYLIPILSFGTAVIHDASNNQIGWLILDLLIFPLGILRGFFIWFFS